MSKKHEIINSWIQFSQVESRNIQQFLSWASYFYQLPKSYIRNILQDYNSQAEMEKREQEKEKIKEYEDFLNEIKKEME